MRPVFCCLSLRIVHLGEWPRPGRQDHEQPDLLGDRVRLLEAGRLAEKTGIELARVREALQLSSGEWEALKEWDSITFTWALKVTCRSMDMADKSGLSLPITGAIKEPVKEARRIKASNPPNWTGNKWLKYG